VQALAEPHDAREGVDDAQPVRAVTGAIVMRARHKEAAIISAEVERRVSMAVLRGPA
jgi:hypothetical protein